MSQKYYNSHYTEDFDFSPNQVDAVLSFFLKRNFDSITAQNLSAAVMNQAKKDNVNIFTLLDKFKETSDADLKAVVLNIMNQYRSKTSVVGYKNRNQNNLYENRNVIF